MKRRWGFTWGFAPPAPIQGGLLKKSPLENPENFIQFVL